MRRLLFALALLATLARTSAADDEQPAPPDPAELLRQAKSAETVDRDPAKAVDLYTRVIHAGGVSPAALEALTRVAQIFESQGKTDDAMLAYRQITDRFASQLDAAAKQAVHAAMTRLTPPGGRARSPLGEVGKPAPVVLEGWAISPLDDKVRSLLQQYENAAKNERPAAKDEIVRMLRPVGAGALPALERAMASEAPLRAHLAAELYGIFAGAKGVEALERMARSGDGFTQGAAIHGLGSVRVAPETSPAVLAAVDRLLGAEALADRRGTLVDLATRHVGSGEAALERHLQGGPDEMAWLRTALDLRAPGAVERAVALAREGSPRAKEAVQALMSQAQNARTRGPKFTPAEVLELIEMTVRTEPLDRSLLTWLLRARVAAATDEEKAEAVVDVWRRALALPDFPTRIFVATQLSQSQGSLPSLVRDEVFHDPEVAKGVVRLIATGGQTGFGEGFGHYAQGNGPFWDAFVDVVPTLSHTDVMNLFAFVQNRRNPNTNSFDVPERMGAAWLRVLESLPADAHYPATVVQAIFGAAARSNDPRFVPLLRRLVTPVVTRLGRWVLGALPEYRGPERLDVAIELLQAPTAEAVQVALTVLSTDPDPRAREAVVRTAADRASPHAALAVDALARAGARTEIAALIARETSATTSAPVAYAGSLVAAAQSLRMREASPFLLRQFKEGSGTVVRPGGDTYSLSGLAQRALESIRAYHEQLATLERWTADQAEDLDALLKDSDPEIRRAAVLALAAAGGKDVLTRLVRIAKDDKEPRVRAAAIQAVERLATRDDAPKPTVPATPAAPKPK